MPSEAWKDREGLKDSHLDRRNAGDRRVGQALAEENNWGPFDAQDAIKDRAKEAKSRAKGRRR
jgi:hypothetical protein